MSPILEISLFFVFALWVIPLTWAIVHTVYAIPGKIIDTQRGLRGLLSTVKTFPARYRANQELCKMTRAQALLEKRFQEVEDDLKTFRRLLSTAISKEDKLKADLQKLQGEVDEIEAESGGCKKGSARVAQKRNELESARRDLERCTFELERLRNKLTEKEANVSKEYSKKQVAVAILKADYATDQVYAALSNVSTETDSFYTRMELRVLKREADAYLKFFLEDRYVSFPTVAKAINKLPIERLELSELQEVLEAVDAAADDLALILVAGMNYGKILSLRVKVARAEVRAWTRKAEEAKFQSNSKQAAQAEQRRAEFALEASNLETMIESAKICSDDFTQMHSDLAAKEREIFDRIAELEKLKRDLEQAQQTGSAEGNSADKT
jgi:uncharacterized protein (DUF3084 family)